MLKKIILKIFPLSTRRGRFVKRIAVKLGCARPFIYDEKYQVWMENAEELRFLHPVAYNKKEKPMFSIVIPMYNTKDKYLNPLINSIADQSFDDWELILADGSNDSDRAAAIESISKSDSRIKYYGLKKNRGISENTNEAIKKAIGEYIVFCDHDDVLSLYALNEMAASIIDNPKIDIIYSDEDKLTDNGLNRYWPHLKPNWSPHQFLTCNYTNHISAIRSSLVNKVGGLRDKYNGAQDYDLLLRVHSLMGEKITVHHIPKILYHWRAADESTAGDFSVKKYALEAGEKALTEYLSSKELKADVSSIEDRPGFYSPKIIPHKNRKALIIVGDACNERMSQSLKETYESITNTSGLSKVSFLTSHEYLANSKQCTVGLNNDDIIVRVTENIIPKSEDWLIRLAGALELDDIYAVSPRILGYDGRIWDMGCVDDIHGNRRMLFRGLLSIDDSIYGHTEWIRDVDCLTGNFVAMRYKDFDINRKEIKSDIDGYYNTVWSPVEAVFYHKISLVGGQYNENIELCSNGSKTVLWQ